MFVISVTYLKPMEMVEQYLPAHVEFLDRYLVRGIFMASGRKNPRTGGIILAAGVTREQLERMIEEDPFKANGIASYEIIDFTPNRTSAEFGSLMDR